MGSFLATLFLALSEFERETTVSRIREGLEAAKANGVKLGRPRNQNRLAQIRRWHDSGKSAAWIAQRLKCSPQNVYNALKKTED